MRMWQVHPRGMCKQHLLGEHFEVHCFVGMLRKGQRVTGYLDKGLLEIHRLRQRHDELAAELVRRGIHHTCNGLLTFTTRFAGYINIKDSQKELHRRCAVCKYKYRRWVKGGVEQHAKS